MIGYIFQGKRADVDTRVFMPGSKQELVELFNMYAAAGFPLKVEKIDNIEVYSVSVVKDGEEMIAIGIVCKDRADMLGAAKKLGF